MFRKPRSITLLLTTVAVLGCGDSTGPANCGGTASACTLSDLTGTWIATQFVYTDFFDSSVMVDIIPLGGVFTLTISEDGNFTVTFRVPDGQTLNGSGTASVAGNTLTLRIISGLPPGQDPDNTDFGASVSENTLTLTNDDDEYDFDGDGSEEFATLRIVLRKE